MNKNNKEESKQTKDKRKEKEASTSFKDSILEKIGSDEVKMRSKLYFILKKAFNVLAIVLIFLLAIYLISFLIFSLNRSGVWQLTGFGIKGIGLFFKTFPWQIVVLIGLGLILVELFVKKLSLVYRKPLLYSIVIVLVLSLLGGWTFSMTSVHPSLFKKAQKHQLLIGGGFYKGFASPDSKEITKATILEKTNQGYKAKLESGQEIAVVVDGQTKTKPQDIIEEGDEVIILGKLEDNTIKAWGIKELNFKNGVNQPKVKGRQRNGLK